MVLLESEAVVYMIHWDDTRCLFQLSIFYKIRTLKSAREVLSLYQVFYKIVYLQNNFITTSTPRK